MIKVEPQPREYMRGRWDWSIHDPWLALRGGSFSELADRLKEAKPWMSPQLIEGIWYWCPILVEDFNDGCESTSSDNLRR